MLLLLLELLEVPATRGRLAKQGQKPCVLVVLVPATVLLLQLVVEVPATVPLLQRHPQPLLVDVPATVLLVGLEAAESVFLLLHLQGIVNQLQQKVFASSYAQVGKKVFTHL